MESYEKRKGKQSSNLQFPSPAYSQFANAREHWSPNKTVSELGSHPHLNEPLSLHPFKPMQARCLLLEVKLVEVKELNLNLNLIDNQLPLPIKKKTYVKVKTRVQVQR